uniref:Uncharacterized protein n=1 Tax=Rhabditophanes sp. KR3021 TaxID=114890 RepID=A0AC35U7P6_9BILA
MSGGSLPTHRDLFKPSKSVSSRTRRRLKDHQKADSYGVSLTAVFNRDNTDITHSVTTVFYTQVGSSDATTAVSSVIGERQNGLQNNCNSEPMDWTDISERNDSISVDGQHTDLSNLDMSFMVCSTVSRTHGSNYLMPSARLLVQERRIQRTATRPNSANIPLIPFRKIRKNHCSCAGDIAKFNRKRWE